MQMVDNIIFFRYNDVMQFTIPPNWKSNIALFLKA